jgi:uncharacterized membrane protein YtjA (UPF0391 family)
MASVAMIILFSDSISSLLNIQEYKTGFTIIAAVCLTPLTFMNLAFLSRMSFIGVASIMFLIFTLFWNVLVFGVRVEDTVTIPSRIEDIGLGIGLLFCGFDAHAVFPTIYHDMERPEHFKTAISTTYSFVTLVYATIGIVGYSAYASGILSEVFFINLDYFKLSSYRYFWDFISFDFIFDHTQPTHKIPFGFDAS